MTRMALRIATLEQQLQAAHEELTAAQAEIAALKQQRGDVISQRDFHLIILGIGVGWMSESAILVLVHLWTGGA